MRLTRFSLEVPFDGEQGIFQLRPSSFTLNAPRGLVLIGALRLIWDGDVSRAPSLKYEFDQQIASIEQY